ncbi:hypothetical protein D3C75_1361320 [compost metagenome]
MSNKVGATQHLVRQTISGQFPLGLLIGQNFSCCAEYVIAEKTIGCMLATFSYLDQQKAVTNR